MAWHDLHFYKKKKNTHQTQQCEGQVEGGNTEEREKDWETRAMRQMSDEPSME